MKCRECGESAIVVGELCNGLCTDCAEEALAERVAEESRRDEWAAEASRGERAQLAWAGGL